MADDDRLLDIVTSANVACGLPRRRPVHDCGGLCEGAAGARRWSSAPRSGTATPRRVRPPPDRLRHRRAAPTTWLYQIGALGRVSRGWAGTRRRLCEAARRRSTTPRSTMSHQGPPRSWAGRRGRGRPVRCRYSGCPARCCCGLAGDAGLRPGRGGVSRTAGTGRMARWPPSRRGRVAVLTGVGRGGRAGAAAVRYRWGGLAGACTATRPVRWSWPAAGPGRRWSTPGVPLAPVRGPGLVPARPRQWSRLAGPVGAVLAGEEGELEHGRPVGGQCHRYPPVLPGEVGTPRASSSTSQLAACAVIWRTPLVDAAGQDEACGSASLARAAPPTPAGPAERQRPPAGSGGPNESSSFCPGGGVNITFSVTGPARERSRRARSVRKPEGRRSRVAAERPAPPRPAPAGSAGARAGLDDQDRAVRGQQRCRSALREVGGHSGHFAAGRTGVPRRCRCPRPVPKTGRVVARRRRAGCWNRRVAGAGPSTIPKSKQSPGRRR